MSTLTAIPSALRDTVDFGASEAREDDSGTRLASVRAKMEALVRLDIQEYVSTVRLRMRKFTGTMQQAVQRGKVRSDQLEQLLSSSVGGIVNEIEHDKAFSEIRGERMTIQCIREVTFRWLTKALAKFEIYEMEEAA